jgi:hypothetical protein
VTGLARILKPIDDSWAIGLPDSRGLAGFTRANAKHGALRYVVAHKLANKAAARAERGGAGQLPGPADTNA